MGRERVRGVLWSLLGSTLDFLVYCGSSEALRVHSLAFLEHNIL